MASPNAGPITGRERIRVLQGGWDIWVNRAQFAAILALTSLPNRPPRPFTEPSAILGTETISAWQDGNKISLSAADITTFLAGSGVAPPHPDPNLPTSFTGNEMIVGQQAGYTIAWSIADVVAIQNGGGSPPVGYAFVTTTSGANRVTTNSGANRVTVRIA